MSAVGRTEHQKQNQTATLNGGLVLFLVFNSIIHVKKKVSDQTYQTLKTSYYTKRLGSKRERLFKLSVKNQNLFWKLEQKTLESFTIIAYLVHF